MNNKLRKMHFAGWIVITIVIAVLVVLAVVWRP